ncbi:hypothetical protein BV22DRAFT_1047445 [Leucogyrophana mollusca]|uniref:Uncharacterized protein n=1 Tax=Leucogyrophana mollusca TaxID=85980 RepID=A0ACB8BH03_9AGAM|nr:hypothetical protein BV22DRAFT_1047445 [Leucogyrophana mollusca]
MHALEKTARRSSSQRTPGVVHAALVVERFDFAMRSKLRTKGDSRRGWKHDGDSFFENGGAGTAFRLVSIKRSLEWSQSGTLPALHLIEEWGRRRPIGRRPDWVPEIHALAVLPWIWIVVMHALLPIIGPYSSPRPYPTHANDHVRQVRASKALKPFAFLVHVVETGVAHRGCPRVRADRRAAGAIASGLLFT